MKNLYLKPLLKTLTIQDKHSGLYIPYDPDAPFSWAQMELVREMQRQYNAQQPVRIIVLKARQLGISTITAGLVFLWSFIKHGSNSLIIAHESDLSQSLFEKTQQNWESWKYRPLYTPKYMSMRRMSWVETKSSIRIATAKNLKSGRGRTIQFLHGSECAFWDDAEELMSGLSQAIPRAAGTCIIMESTANRVGGWFFDQWQMATHGESDYTPLFFPWFKHYEYQLPAASINPNNLPPNDRRIRRNLDKTEEDLIGLGASLENLEWRRWALANLLKGDEEMFRQEYPATPQEAFLTSGVAVFPAHQVYAVYNRWPGVRGEIVVNPRGEYVFNQDSLGPITIYRQPSSNREWGKYVVVGDPTHTTRGDRACIQVLNARTYEQVAVWHGRIDPITFADELIKLGYYYNTALLNTEIDGPGYATISRILTLDYPNVWMHRWADKAPGKVSSTNAGWLTNFNRKNWAIGLLKWLIATESITLHDPITYHQLLDYTVLNDIGEMGNSSKDGFDDAVMALAIAVATTLTSPPEDYDSVKMPQPATMFGQPVAFGRPIDVPQSNEYYGIPLDKAFEVN